MSETVSGGEEGSLRAIHEVIWSELEERLGWSGGFSQVFQVGCCRCCDCDCEAEEEEDDDDDDDGLKTSREMREFLGICDWLLLLLLPWSDGSISISQMKLSLLN